MDNAIDLQPPAKAAAHDVIMDDDFLRRQACQRRRGLLGGRHVLCPNPQFAGIVAHMNGAVHRLHRRMRKEGQLIDGIDPHCSGGKCCCHIALAARHGARLF